MKETGKGGRLEPRDDNPLRLKPEQAFSLKHRNDLLADCSPEDIDEIKSTVLEVLASFAGGECHEAQSMCMCCHLLLD